jgi:hypothetical protein
MNKVKVYCPDLGMTFDSIVLAGKELGINVKSINMCINGRTKRAGGYEFVRLDNAVDSAKNERLLEMEEIVRNLIRENRKKTNEIKQLNEKVNALIFRLNKMNGDENKVMIDYVASSEDEWEKF